MNVYQITFYSPNENFNIIKIYEYIEGHYDCLHIFPNMYWIKTNESLTELYNKFNFYDDLRFVINPINDGNIDGYISNYFWKWLWNNLETKIE